MSQLPGRPRGRIPFRHVHHVGQNIRDFFAAAEAFAETAIATEPRKARHGQIPQSAQAGKRFPFGAARHAEPANLDNRPGHQRRFGIIAKTQSIRNAGGNGNDVLQRAAQLDTQQVGARIDAKCRPMKQILHFRRCLDVRAGRHNGGRNSAGDFQRQCRSGQRGDARLRRVLAQNAAHRQSSVVFDPLRDADGDSAVVGQTSRDFAEGL